MLSRQLVCSFAAIALFVIVGSESECQTSTSNSKQETSETLLRQAEESSKVGDWDRSADILKHAVHKDPNNSKLWWHLCWSYQLSEQASHAMKACKHVVKLDPSWSTHSALGQVYVAKRDYRKAVDEFENAIADTNLSPDSAVRSILLEEYVSALLNSNQYERAIPAAKRLVEVSWEPTRQDAYRTLAIAYMKTGQREKAQEAIRSGYGPDCFLQIADKSEDSGVGCKHGFPEGWIPFR